MAVAAATPAAIEEAARLLREGKLVAFPTETVYGLGADATDGRAVAAIYAAKQRPRFNPLIVHVADIGAARRLGMMGELEMTLAQAFWPGPLTLVIPKQPHCPVSKLATCGLDTLAVRIPSHAVALALLRAADRPIVAPSANRSGHVSTTRAEHVAADLGSRVAMILDDGATHFGLESTIVSVARGELQLLRPGAIGSEQIAHATGRRLIRTAGDVGTPNAPGQLASHYAPRAKLRLQATHVRSGEALLGFGPHPPSTRGPAINLSPSGDLIEAAANLYSALRTLDASGAQRIAVMPIPASGLGEAINDRLARAAAPR
jgi:L-threonylcarbamoyladenylate synthase